MGSLEAYSQYSIPPYTIQVDSATRTTVFHTNLSDSAATPHRLTDTLHLILPDIKIKNGIVDHKRLTGEMLVREYFVDSILIGYIEYDRGSFFRERYFYSNGDIFLDKQYENGELKYTKNKIKLQ